MSIDKRWHLATSEEEIKLTEFELQLWRVHYGFMSWQEHCEKTSNGESLSSDELAVLHIIRMQDRPKTTADIGRLLNRDNFFNIEYNIRKLIKMDLVKKVQSKEHKKRQLVYMVTEKGKQNTDAYTEVRRNILINEFKNDLLNINLEEVTAGLMKLKAVYEEAVRVASTYKPASKNKIQTKK